MKMENNRCTGELNEFHPKSYNKNMQNSNTLGNYNIKKIAAVKWKSRAAD